MNYIDQRLLRIGVFYDGNFFFHVSNYYRYAHERRMRLSIPGLHEFIRHQVAEAENVDVRYCQIIDSHYFRGRLSAKVAEARHKLYAERVFDDILMNEGVVTHYLPLRRGGEKGIDVWLALEAFELAALKKFNVLVIIAGDSDFIPLARKVNSLGTRVMVLGWDFMYTDEQGIEKETTTSIHLLNEVTYPIKMHQRIDDKTKREDPLIKNLFVEERRSPPSTDLESAPISEKKHTQEPERTQTEITSESASDSKAVSTQQVGPNVTQIAISKERFTGHILNLNNGFGFIKSDKHPQNVFFHFSSLSNVDFSDLKANDKVEFSAHDGEKGPIADDVEVLG